MESFLNEYEIIFGSTSHQGASASIYKVRHKTLGYVRAIRVLNQTVLNEDDPIYQRFQEECKILLRLNNGGHPNIVRITQPRLLQGHALVEMEFVEGEDLNEYIANTSGSFVPYHEVLNFVKDITSALAYCHHDIYKFCINKDTDDFLEDDDEGNVIITPESEQKLIEKYRVIHNDIHSKNVIRKYDGSYILLDFGLAIQNNTVVKSSTRKGGAIEYKSPEKWDDDGNISEQSDIYSLGILMYEMLAGRVPFVLEKTNSLKAEFDLGKKHFEETPPQIELLRADYFRKNNPGVEWKKDYPLWMEEMILKCLNKNPADRFRNAKELNDFILKQIKQEDEIKISQSVPFEFEKEKNALNNKIIQLNAELKGKSDLLIESGKKLSIVENEVQSLKSRNVQLMGTIDTLKKQSAEKTRKGIAFIWVFLLILLFSGASFFAGKFFIKNQNPVLTENTRENLIGNTDEIKDKEFTLNGKHFIYNGQLDDKNIPHGWGKAQYDDESFYEGTFNHGKLNRGKIVFSNGCYYVGDFNKHGFDGMGVYYFQDGSWYEGRFTDNKITGNGTLFDSDGIIVARGEFEDGELKKK